MQTQNMTHGTVDPIQLYNDIIVAHKNIRPHIFETPLEYSPTLSTATGSKLYLKLECNQCTGSFKLRGAVNKCVNIQKNSARDGKPPLIITASTGNHGLACAKAMTSLNIQGSIYIPVNVRSSKKFALECTGAKLVYKGEDCVDTELAARNAALNQNILYVSPYNDLDVIAGQGTIGAEIYEKLPSVDIVFVAVGGGGLISGISVFLKHVRPSVKIVGCQPAESPVMMKSVKAGHVIAIESGTTLSDGTAGGIEPDAVTFELCQKYVDEWVDVSEEEIADAIFYMLDVHHQVIEGAAGVALAGFRKNSNTVKDQSVVVVLCGRNISTCQLKSIINTHSKD